MQKEDILNLPMTKNPILNALAAVIYIIFVASIMFYGTQRTGPVNNVMVPVAVVSLFTLSAAVMGYLFGYQPFMLYFDGKKKEAVNLFLKTVAVFGAVTLIILILLFSGALR